MKKAGVLSIVLCALAVMGLSNNLGAEDLKIGTVNFQQALNQVEQGKRAKASLQSEFDAKQKKLAAQQDELKRIQEEVQKQGSVLSQETLAQKQKDFQTKLMDMQKNMAGYRDELMAKEAKMTSQILQNMKTLVSEVAQKDGYTLVVETSQDAVLYAKSKDDLTQKMIGMYNSRFTGPIKMD